MKVGVRETDDAVFLDFIGPFTSTDKDRHDATVVVSAALEGGKDPIFVLRAVDFENEVDLGNFIAVLSAARVPMSGLGLPPYIKIVTDSDLIKGVSQVADSVFRCFTSEEEALR